jgi:hypothetical protein
MRGSCSGANTSICLDGHSRDKGAVLIVIHRHNNIGNAWLPQID